MVERDCVTVLNNETGFQEKNIKAICDVGRSTKGKHKYGYIGKYVCDAVMEIHSISFLLYSPKDTKNVSCELESTHHRTKRHWLQVSV